MLHLVAVIALALLGASDASAQERGWLAIGTDSVSHAYSFRSADDAVNSCGYLDCEVVETFTACLAVAYSSETDSGRPVWTWIEAATEGDARPGAQDACEAAGGLACAVENTYCLDGARPAAPPAATAEQENIFWLSIMNSTSPADFEAYLSRFPNGVFSDLAQNRLTALRLPAGSPPAAAAAADVHTSPSALFRPDQTRVPGSRPGRPAGRRFPGSLDVTSGIHTPGWARS